MRNRPFKFQVTIGATKSHASAIGQLSRTLITAFSIHRSDGNLKMADPAP
jgi:hypothetical protein